jgi:hypothetical protein
MIGGDSKTDPPPLGPRRLAEHQAWMNAPHAPEIAEIAYAAQPTKASEV